MPNLTDLLHDAVGEPDVSSSFDELEGRAGVRRVRRRRRQRAVVAIGCVALLAVIGVAVRSRSTSHQRVATEPSPATVTSSASTVITTPTGPLFSTPTGDVLIFDDGYDAITVVDLDHRVVIRRYGIGESAGDQPFRMTRVGSEVLVGSGAISAVPIAGGDSRVVGNTTVYIPAVEPDRVWFVDYPNESGTPPRAQFVEVSTGRVLADVLSPFVGGPSIGTGIEGGFALVTDHGLDLWHLDSQSVVAHLGSASGGQGQTFDAVGSRLAWCQADLSGYCDTLHVTDLAAPRGSPDVIVANYAGESITGARFSPDGQRVAVSMMVKGQSPADPSGRVVVEGRGLHRVIDVPLTYPNLGWSTDGSRLYVASSSYGQAQATLTLWTQATDSIEQVTLPFGGMLQFVTATVAELGPHPDQRELPVHCPPTEPFRGPAKQDCAFGF